MHIFSKPYLAICSSILLLTGCQHFYQPKSVSIPPHLQDENHFNLQGKIGVRTPQQSGSAFFTWVQQPNQFTIELAGALGIGRTHIQGQSGQVSLISDKTGKITASSAEELLEKATGWQAPVTHLSYWIQAKPATAHAQITRDQNQRLQQLTEDGWHVDFNYSDTHTLPNRLVIKQALAAGGENRITMVIQNR